MPSKPTNPSKPNLSVTLEALKQEQYADWLNHGIKEFAADKVKANDYTPEQAMQLSQSGYDSLLPNGLETPDHFIFNIVNKDGETVGTTWFALIRNRRDLTAFLYDIEIEQTRQGKGYGRASMAAIEKEAKRLGVACIELHVFAFNKVAKGLYDSIGFETTDVSMSKRLIPNKKGA